MALTVGELNGIISVDDQAVDPALRRAEAAMRASGERMGSDAEQAGEQAGRNLGDGTQRGFLGRIRAAFGRFRSTGEDAGEALGEGVVQGADGRLRNARGQFVAAGRRAGDAVGDGLADAATEGADDAVDQAGGRFERLKALAMGAGLMAGAALALGIQESLNQGQITATLGAQLGATGPEAQRFGKVAGELFKGAIVADFQEGADTIKAVMNAGLVPPEATNAQIQSISTNLADLAKVLGIEVGEAANAAGQMVRNGLAKNSQEAIDMLTQASNKGANRFGDLGDTITQSANNLSHFGLNGKQAMGVMIQGLDAGAPSAELFAGALEEMAANAGDGAELFGDLGFNGKKMAKDLAGGGPAAGKALDQLMDKLRTMKDPTERSAAMVELFGEEAVAMQGALLSIDPSAAASKLGNFSGAADKAGRGMRDNAAANLTEFKNTVQQNVVDFLGTKAVPALVQAFGFVREHSGAFKVAGMVITGVLVPALILMGINATLAAGRVVVGWTMSGAAATRSAGVQVVAGVRVVGGWIAQGVAATGQGLRVAGAWLMTGARATAGAVMQVLAGARVVAGWVLMGVQSMLQAGRMAAAWFIAMGPVGWVIAGIVGLVALIIANWDTVKRWTAAAWSWVVDKLIWAKDMMISAFLNFTLIGLIIKHWSTIKQKTSQAWNALIGWLRGVPGMIYQAFLNWTLLGLIIKHWSSIKTATVRKAGEMLAYVRSLPGRISAGIGSLGSLLTDKGRNVVQGLWNGIKGMGGWLRDRVVSFAKDTVSGGIKSALGISSPSKVTKAQGRWVVRGLVEGLTGSKKQVLAASRKLADIVTDGLKPGKKRSLALGRISAGSKQLLKLASGEEKLAARLKSASTKLADLVEERAKLTDDVRKGVLDSANITQGQGPMTGAGILARLQRDRKQAEAFAKSLATLQKKGVRADLIRQIAEAGVEQGSAAAAALATATPAQIKKINSEQAALVKVAGKAGATAGNAMYAAGVAAGQGLVKGLQSQQKSIDAQMLRIAKGMQGSIRKALKIKSPSRVMAAIGQNITAGLRRGIDSGRGAVDRSMAGLVSTPTPRQMAMSAAASTGQGVSGGRVVNNSNTTTYNLTQREMTLRDLEALQRRRDALARVGRPK